MHQDLADPVIGPGSFPTMAAFTAAERTYLSTQFRFRSTVAEEAEVRALPNPVEFAPLCNHHVGLESGAFYDDAVRIPPSPFTDYSDNLGDWWDGGTPSSLIDGIDGAVTDTANCVS
jgi:hypothetical protein